ncbi:hypothetical protein AVEN_22566-2-1, partial [Araneus ventricosus]
YHSMVSDELDHSHSVGNDFTSKHYGSLGIFDLHKSKSPFLNPGVWQLLRFRIF